MTGPLDLLILRTWWSYDPDSDWYWHVYHWLNLIEGSVWILFALLVLVRYVRKRKSALEVLYSLAFLSFGLSDFREAYIVQSWLLLFKVVNVVCLLCLRRFIMGRFYPKAKTY